MEIKTIATKTTWDNFLNENGSPSFLQSWEWGEMEKALGDKIIRLGIYEKDQLDGICLVRVVKAKRGNFILIPHGPILQVQSEKFKVKNYLKSLRNYLIQIAKEEKCLFIRISPIVENTEENKKVFQELGFRTAPIYLHAETVWVLDLATNLTASVEERSGRTEAVCKTDEQLLQEMRKTTRYLIKRAVKDGVTIEKSTNEKKIDDFWKLYEETAKREHFSPFPKKFIIEEFKAFQKTNNAILLIGKHENKVLASALIIFTKSTGFYHQGASIHTKIPVPYLLQWEAIKEAKNRGCKLYNFWGILQHGRTPRGWSGLTLFKQGFGGRQINYILTQDYVLSPKYYLTYLYEKYLAWRRGI